VRLACLLGLVQLSGAPRHTASAATDGDARLCLPLITNGPPSCPDANACITWPRMDAKVSGQIAIRGTAKHEHFLFYKVEYALSECQVYWWVIGDLGRSPVESGVLVEFETTRLPNGVDWLRLTVVDQAGSSPPPHQVHIVIANSALAAPSGLPLSPWPACSRREHRTHAGRTSLRGRHHDSATHHS